MRLRTPKKADAMIPTASMADIAFLLIIFFMVTTVHEVDRTSVNLPLAKSRTEAEKGSAIVVLSKDPSGVVGNFIYMFSDGKNMSHPVSGPRDIYFEATNKIAQDNTTQFILKADGDIPFEKIDELLDTLRQADVTKVLLLCQQATIHKGVPG
jgi:biopolymer transport protein ExbD